jgi:hypothetical protein
MILTCFSSPGNTFFGLKYTLSMAVMKGMAIQKDRGFIGIEAGIALAVLIALGLAAIGGYKAYHASMSAEHEASSTVSGSAVASPAHPAPVEGPGEAATTSPRIVTNADNGKAVHLHVGDTFILKLGDSLKWSGVTITDNGVVTAVPTFAVIPGAEGTYEARAKGTATISATGAPVCKADEACPLFLALFTATVVVD